MPVTFLEVATLALTDIGSLGVGEVPNESDAALCQYTFDQMMGEWSTDRLLLFTIGSAPYALSADVQQYQIGPGAVAPGFNTSRPVLIQSAATIIPGTTARRAMDLLSSQEWAALGEKGLTGVFPDKLYFDNAYPIASLFVHPVPSAAITIELYTFSLLQQIVNLTDVLNFPPGYLNALRQNLAVKISPAFGMPLQQVTVQQAVSGKAAIAQINANLYRGALGTSSMFPLPTEGAPAPPAPPPQVAQQQ